MWTEPIARTEPVTVAARRTVSARRALLVAPGELFGAPSWERILRNGRAPLLRGGPSPWLSASGSGSWLIGSSVDQSANLASACRARRVGGERGSRRPGFKVRAVWIGCGRRVTFSRRAGARGYKVGGSRP